MGLFEYMDQFRGVMAYFVIFYIFRPIYIIGIYAFFTLVLF
jgi:hypothetical protein